MVISKEKAKCPKRRGKYARDKGKRFERMIANILKERGFDAKRGVQFKGSYNSHDIECEALDYYNLETKFVEKLNITEAMNQAVNDCGSSGQKPVVIHKKSNCDTLVTMQLHDWIDLVQWAHDYVDKYNYLEVNRDRFKAGLSGQCSGKGQDGEETPKDTEGSRDEDLL